MFYTEARVMNYEENFHDLCRRYSENFCLVEIGEESVKKYFLFEGAGNDKMLIMLSRMDPNSLAVKFNKYNVMLSVHANSQDMAARKIEEIVDKFGIEAKEAPKAVLDTWDESLGLSDEGAASA